VYLKRVRVRGFKSFARVTDLVLESGVAVVIGPNGSGKSNLAEAVMWALGEQSPSSLRGGSMQDVIFAGSDGRRAGGGAEVELVFDNSDGTLPLPSDEVSVGRRVHRDGQTTYTINHSPCRLADVTELMSGVGLGRAAHAVIGQGRVEWFLASKPVDRRALIEEAAGLGRYKRRRERTQLKLRETARNLERIHDLEREVGSQLTPLRRQASAAEQLRAVTTELAELRGRLLAGELQTLEGQLGGLRREHATAEAEQAGIDDELGTLESRRAAEEERFARLLQERERRAQRVLRGRVLLGRLESCTRLTEQRVRLLDELQRAGAAERERLLVELSGGGALEDDAWPAERERLQAAVAAEEARHGAAAAELALGRRRLGEARADQTRAAAERDETVLRAARLRERHAALGSQTDALQSRVAELEREVTALTAALETARVAAAANAAADAAAGGALERADAEDAAAREALAVAEGRVRELAGAAAAAAAERDHVAAAAAGLSELDDAVVSTLRAFPGAAAVASSLECDRGYERALGAALMRLEAGVEVPSGIDPWTLLDALRDAGARLVRLVLPRVAGPGSSDITDAGPRGEAGTARSGQDERMAGALGEGLAAHVQGAGERIAELLRDVVVVQDIRAVPSDFAGLAVTRDGAFYAPRDGQLGLAGAAPAAAALERRALLATLSERARQIEQELARAREERDERRRTAEHTAGARHEASRAALSAREAVQASEREAGAVEERLRDIESRLARALREREAHQAEAADLEEELERLDVAAAQGLVLVERLAAPLAAAEEALAGLEEAHDAALGALARARVELEERSAAAERAARERAEAERRLAAGRARLETLERRLRETPTIARASRELLERFAALTELAEKLTGHLSAPAGDDEAVDRRTLRDLADREAELRRRREDVSERRAGLRVDAARLEERQSEVRTAFEAVAEELERARFEPPADPEEAAALAQAIERAERRRERIGPVNPLAEAECTELGERAAFLREQRRDLERSLQELDGLIAELTQRIDADFATMFDDIRGHFSDMAGTLFPGGRGTMFLVDEQDGEPAGVGVEIKPGRKLGKRLQMLSGGERALAAIAFLMALVLANPAPFYVLDEIEAALDDVNIGRLVALLREYRHRTQFIIITHQKRTMEAADILYGVTMGPDGVSHVVSARMAEEEIDRQAAERPADRGDGGQTPGDEADRPAEAAPGRPGPEAAAGGESADDEGAEAPARRDETGLSAADEGAEA